MIIKIKKNEIEAMKWLLLKGMEQTNSERKFKIFERISDELHQNNKKRPCPICGGTGRRHSEATARDKDHPGYQCDTCYGTGEVDS